MIFSQSKKGSIIQGVILFIFLAAGWTGCLAQEGHANASELYLQVYEATQDAMSHDPVIQNGVYYTYPYYNAIGHPFLGQKEFETGSVIFRGKSYEALSINYELFNQQIILSREYNGVLQMNVLAPEFISEFYLKGKQFIKAEFQEGAPEFFQVIVETPGISCYYTWYKERREIRDTGNRSIYSFSDQKSKCYLLLDGRLNRYKSNKSFLKIFPDGSKAKIKTYLQDNQILVLEASDQEMSSLINYCDSVLDQALIQGGE